jgi:NAD(P)-dependent dehydrogenase (short-subunit alcohol dehydrogenase family)
LALKFADLGANIIIADINSVEGLKTVEEIRGKDVKAEFYKVDVTDYEQVSKFQKEVANSEFGHVDILVNNAGLIDYMTLVESPVEDLERLVGVNFTSLIFVSGF